MLRQGLLKLNLWPVQNTEGTPDVSLTTPIGSTAINPDVNNCVSLYIENPEHKVSSVFAKDLENTFLSDPLKEVCYNGLYCAPTINRHQ